jgi:hypothetical protein
LAIEMAGWHPGLLVLCLIYLIRNFVYTWMKTAIKALNTCMLTTHNISQNFSTNSI